MKIFLKDVEKFKLMLIKNGYSQRSFGKAASISPPYACQISNGNRCPGPNIAKKICEILKVEFDDIFFIDSGYKSDQTA